MQVPIKYDKINLTRRLLLANYIIGPDIGGIIKDYMGQLIQIQYFNEFIAEQLCGADHNALYIFVHDPTIFDPFLCVNFPKLYIDIQSAVKSCDRCGETWAKVDLYGGNPFSITVHNCRCRGGYYLVQSISYFEAAEFLKIAHRNNLLVE